MPVFPDPPSPPDPRKTAAAQTGTNVATAVANAALNNVDQRTPYGDINYNVTGYTKFRDPVTKKTYKVPNYEVKTDLSKRQKQIQRGSELAQINLAQTAQERSAFLEDYLPQAGELDTAEVEGRLYDLGSQRLDPRFERQREGLRTRLANQGVAPGTEAYAREMEALSQAENDAYNQLMMTGRGQAFSEALARRNQPINEITALLSGSQVSNPTAAPVNMPGIPTTDFAGLEAQNFAQRQANYGQRVGQTNSLLGGLFGLGAAGIGTF